VKKNNTTPILPEGHSLRNGDAILTNFIPMKFSLKNYEINAVE
jgi:hypothetical protein